MFESLNHTTNKPLLCPWGINLTVNRCTTVDYMVFLDKCVGTEVCAHCMCPNRRDFWEPFITDRSSPRAGGQKQTYSKEKVNPLEHPELRKHQQSYLTNGDNHIQRMNNNISDRDMGNKSIPMNSSYHRGDCCHFKLYFQFRIDISDTARTLDRFCKAFKDIAIRVSSRWFHIVLLWQLEYQGFCGAKKIRMVPRRLWMSVDTFQNSVGSIVCAHVIRLEENLRIESANICWLW